MQMFLVCFTLFKIFGFILAFKSRLEAAHHISAPDVMVV